MPATGGKVLVAMSGGVDSSVAAALLQRAGYEVVGCFMRLGSPGESLDELIEDGPAATASTCRSPAAATATIAATTDSVKPGRTLRIGHQGCCSINDAADARLVAARLGIPFYVCNFKKDFGRIIDYFVAEYDAGRTPNPCIRCNDWLKFGKLHDYARRIDADFVATGHYARVSSNDASTNGRSHNPSPRLLRGIDHDKDQSYVLFGVPRARLREMLLPIGEYRKPAVRALAREFDLPVFDKPDSQEICFVPDNDYAGLVARKSSRAVAAGAILDPDGQVIGEHPGHQHFTIGQRRGVRIAAGDPLYVIRKDADANTITVGPRELLRTAGCIAHEVNWLVDPPTVDEPTACTARIRSNAKPVPAQLIRRRSNGVHEGGTDDAIGHSDRADETIEVRFEDPQNAVAPGQAVVCYDDDEPDLVLGGGWIESSL